MPELEATKMVIRPIRMDDLEEYVSFAFRASLGLISMPRNKSILKKKIQLAHQAFSSNVIQPGDQRYLFVIADSDSGKLGGTSGIIARTGVTDATYFYTIETEHRHSDRLKLEKTLKLLRLIGYRNAASELCSLYLDPDFRSGGLGRLLSLSRLLFIADHSHRFTSKIIAEMRGVIREDGTSPFWRGLGSHFYDYKLVEIFKFLEEGQEFIPEVLPRYPIYIDLLPHSAQLAIGDVHPQTKPALKMLESEGFSKSGEVDVFDAGAKLIATVQKLRVIKDSIVANIIGIEQHIENNDPIMLLSNRQLDFRACIGKIKVRNNGVTITSQAAQNLGLEIGQSIRYVPIRPTIPCTP